MQQAIPYLEENLKKNPLYSVMLISNSELSVYEVWMKHIFTMIMSQKNEINSDVAIYIYVFESNEDRKIGIDAIKNSHKKCGNCKKTSTNRCSGCNIIYYCSQKCHKNHWNEHKKLCRLIQ